MSNAPASRAIRVIAGRKLSVEVMGNVCVPELGSSYRALDRSSREVTCPTHPRSNPKTQSPKILFLLSAILGDIHDFVFVDEQIGGTLAGKPDHILVVIFDPAADGLSIHQLDRNRLLFFAQPLEERCFLKRVFRRGRTSALGTRIPMRWPKGHVPIVHNVTAGPNSGESGAGFPSHSNQAPAVRIRE